MSGNLSASAQRVEDALAARGLPGRVQERSEPTRSAAEAAAAVGCTVAQIAKSLVFRGVTTGGGVMVIASGANRVDEGKVAAVLGEPIAKADAAFVRAATGFAIGGVPPLAHATPLVVLIDQDLARFDRIWAAAGTPNAVFPLSPDELVMISNGRLADIRS